MVQKKQPVKSSSVDRNNLLMREINGEWQKSISETNLILRWMSYNSRRLHWVPLLSAKNRKLRLQWASAHWNWTVEDWKNISWSDESWFLLRHINSKVRIWHQWQESMDKTCLVLTVQAGGGVMEWHTLSLLVPANYCLNATAYLSIVPGSSCPQCIFSWLIPSW